MFGGSVYDDMKVSRAKKMRDGIAFFTVAATMFECVVFSAIAPMLPKGQLPYPWNVVFGVGLLAFIMAAGVGAGIMHARYRIRRAEAYIAEVKSMADQIKSNPLPSGVIWSGAADIFIVEHRTINPLRNDKRYKAVNAKNLLLGVRQVKGPEKTISYYVRVDAGSVEVMGLTVKLSNYKELPHDSLLSVALVDEGEKVKLTYRGVGAIYIAPKKRGLEPAEDSEVLAAAMAAAARVDVAGDVQMIDYTQEVL